MHTVTTLTTLDSAQPQVLEFFAGIGLARKGLEQTGFRVVWANDNDPDKKAMYEAEFGAADSHRFVLGDIATVSADQLPTGTALAWASSPCTDLSLAGGRAGLRGVQSGAFWHFIRLLDELGSQRPPVAVLENVVGLATSHGGEDLAAAVRAFNELDYSVDILTLDARRFVPQSRPRLFLVAAHHPPDDAADPTSELRPDWLQTVYGDRTLRTHRADIANPPAPLTSGLEELIEYFPPDHQTWWDEERTSRFVSSLSPAQRERVSEMQWNPWVTYRTAYRRTRHGTAVWEVRPDSIAGCLRTARGGSSKQAVVSMGSGALQVRWMLPQEYARLMGAGEYNFSAARTNQALCGFGDAVAVPVVKWLSENYLMPLMRGDFTQLRPSPTLGLSYG